jgi:hypothetical protein
MLQINLFTSYPKRVPFTKLALHQLTQISEKNKGLITLHVYFNNTMKDTWMEELTHEKYQDIDVVLHLMEKDEYILKVPIAHSTDAMFSCKWDDDVLIGTPTWDYIIDNINVLNMDRNISVLAPQLTNGIPSVDRFMRDLLSDEEIDVANQMFLREGLKTHLDIWGADYRGVQTFIESMDSWDGDKYWEFVESYNPIATRQHLPPNFKWARGVHPARFSYDFNMYIANKILKNKDKLYGKNNFYIETKETAYFCNNIFFTLSDYWRKSFVILQDGYDEGQLTVYAKANGMKPAYVRNSFGIHMAYGCTPQQGEIESFYLKELTC